MNTNNLTELPDWAKNTSLSDSEVLRFLKIRGGMSYYTNIERIVLFLKRYEKFLKMNVSRGDIVSTRSSGSYKHSKVIGFDPKKFQILVIKGTLNQKTKGDVVWNESTQTTNMLMENVTKILAKNGQYLINNNWKKVL